MWFLFAFVWLILLAPLVAGGMLAFGGTVLAVGLASMLFVGLFRFMPFLVVAGIFYMIYKQSRSTESRSQNRQSKSQRRNVNSCPSCGADVPSDKVVCPYCHADLKTNCPKCGEIVDIRRNRCPHCGTDVHSGDQQKPHTEVS